MPSHPLYQVDAFTTTPLQGNPCVVILDADDLPAETMLALAREMNLSETAFVLHSDVADFRARYFTPAEEIPLAGHPTISTIFTLIKAGRLDITEECQPISLELQAGVIRVEVTQKDGYYHITMYQKKPVFMMEHDPAAVMPVFGLTPDDLLPDVPVQTVSTGTPQLMIPVRDLEVLRRAELQPKSYKALRAQSDFFSPHLFCLEGISGQGQTFARHFGVPPDTMEDPFTGSATGGMGAYLWHYGLIESPRFIAEQGHWMNHPGSAVVEIIGLRDDIETVSITGTAVMVFMGALQL